MKPVQTPFLRIVILFFAIISSSCTKLSESTLTHQIWLPWFNSQGSYSIQKVNVATVTNWSPLRGSAAQIRSNVKQIDNDTFSSQEVILQYSEDESGAIIPMSRFSMEVASIYAHFERLQKLDKDFNVPDSDVARKVYVKFLDYVPGGYIRINNASYDAANDSFFILPYMLKRIPLSVNGGVLAHEYFHSIFARFVWLPLNKKLQSLTNKSVLSLNESNIPKKEINEVKSFFQEKPLNVSSVEETSAPSMEKTTSSNQNINATVPSLQSKDTELPKITSIETLDSLNLNANLKIKFINRTIFLGMNEGLADIWGWLYTGDPCFMSASFGSGLTNERCLNVDPIKLKLKDSDSLGSNYSGFRSVEEQVRENIYPFGTNLAQLIYLRIAERGELQDAMVLRQWAKRIIEVLPSFLPHLTTVFLDEESKKSIIDWKKMVDTLLFGPGSTPVLPENCQRWQTIFGDNNKLFENFNSKCTH